MARSWEQLRAALPPAVGNVILTDGYDSAAVFASSFRNEEILDKYAVGLILIRKVWQVRLSVVF